MSASSSPFFKPELALRSLDSKRRASFCCCFSCRARSFARFCAVGLEVFAILAPSFLNSQILSGLVRPEDSSGLSRAEKVEATETPRSARLHDVTSE